MLYERTLGQWLEHWAETTPDKEYIVYSDRNLRFTWSQFNHRVDDMAKGLIAIGVERGTHVGIWAANVPDWLTLLYACAKIGAVYVTVNTNYKQAELEYLCQNSDMHTLCIVNGEKDSDFVQMTYQMLPELRTCQRGHLKSERFPHMKNVIYVGQEKHRGMYNTSEILLLGNNVADDRLNELKARVKGTGNLPRCRKHAIHQWNHRFPKRRNADPLQHNQQRFPDRRAHEVYCR